MGYGAGRLRTGIEITKLIEEYEFNGDKRQH